MTEAASNCAPESPIGHAAAWWWDFPCGGRSLPATARMPTNSPAATLSPIWGGRRHFMTVWSRSKRYEPANAGGGDVAIVHGADAVIRTHRGVRGTQARQSRQCRLQVARVPIEMDAIGAAWSSRGFHCPKRLQNPSKTCVESTKPSRTFTATPAVKA